MIDFVNFGEHKMEKNHQNLIKDGLLNCLNENSHYFWINMIYNNVQHFSNSSYSHNSYQFLHDISTVANSKVDKITVMGGAHNDTGHTSGLVLYQLDQNIQPIGSFVSDSYIRFTIKLKSTQKLSTLNELQIFHFLIDVPTVIWTKEKHGNIIIHNIPWHFDNNTASNYYPHVTSKKLKIYRAS